MKWIGGLGCGVSGYVIWLTVEENTYLQPTINFGRYCNASARCEDCISSLPARSTMMRTRRQIELCHAQYDVATRIKL
jgi:hypothetical protein